MKFFMKAMLLGLVSFNVLAQHVLFNGIQPSVIIDVRTPAEFSVRHIESAINIPVDQIVSEGLSLNDLKKESVILLYCRSGARSAKARAALEKQGYINVLDGGSMESLMKSLQHR